MKIPIPKNPFWLAMALAGIALVAIFFLSIWPLWGKVSRLKEDLSEKERTLDRLISRGNKVPTDEWVKQMLQYQHELKEEIEQCKDYYKKSDEPLERWFEFERSSLDANGVPFPAKFKTRYLKERDNLIKMLEDGGVKIEGEKEDKENALGFGDPATEAHQTLQKHFWIQEKIIQVMVDSNVAGCEKISFISSKPSRSSSRRSGGRGERMGRGTGLANTTEQDLPSDLGTWIPFELIVTLNYKNVPHFIYNMISTEQRLFFIVLKDIEIVRMSEEITKYSEILEPEELPKEEERDTWCPPTIGPPLVRVMLFGQVLDFEIK